MKPLNATLYAWPIGTGDDRWHEHEFTEKSGVRFADEVGALCKRCPLASYAHPHVRDEQNPNSWSKLCTVWFLAVGNRSLDECMTDEGGCDQQSDDYARAQELIGKLRDSWRSNNEQDTDGVTPERFERFDIPVSGKKGMNCFVTVAQGDSGAWYTSYSYQCAGGGCGFAPWPKFSRQYRDKSAAIVAGAHQLGEVLDREVIVGKSLAPVLRDIEKFILSHRTIDAYFTGTASYSVATNKPADFHVSIKYTDDTWNEIYRDVSGEKTWNEIKTIMADIILEHHIGSRVDGVLVTKLLVFPGYGLRRITPSELDVFLKNPDGPQKQKKRPKAKQPAPAAPESAIVIDRRRLKKAHLLGWKHGGDGHQLYAWCGKDGQSETWGATATIDDAYRFGSVWEAIDFWRSRHAVPENHEHCIWDGYLQFYEETAAGIRPIMPPRLQMALF